MDAMRQYTLGVLTSGGDAPGMNSCIRSVVRTAATHNVRVIGVNNGFEGLINGEFRVLGPRDVGGILQRGGTILQTRRSERFKDPRGQREAIRHINEAGMDGLVVIGANDGDDATSFRPQAGYGGVAGLELRASVPQG